MLKFHSSLASLDMVKCTTCLEQFPGLNMHSGSTECARCHRDHHTPKLYSPDNNMDPGVVPVQLQVSTNMSNIDTFLLNNYTGAILPPHDFFHAAGLDSGRGDADICCVAHHNPLPVASKTVWLQWPCHQPASGCRFFCQQPTTTPC